MKSWAVPKGPSFDPADKRMAVHVEDHPISYNSFEGTIPPGNYGAGKVIIWDKGVWIPLEDPQKGYRDGKLKFELRGHKMHGHWALVRMKARGDERQEPWLLIKEKDDYVRPASEFSVVDEMPDSVKALADRPAARHVRLPRPQTQPPSASGPPAGAKKRRYPRSCSPSSRRWWMRRPRTTTTGSTRSSSTAIACSPAPRAAACASSPATATTGPANCRSWRRRLKPWIYPTAGTTARSSCRGTGCRRISRPCRAPSTRPVLRTSSTTSSTCLTAPATTCAKCRWWNAAACCSASSSESRHDKVRFSAAFDGKPQDIVASACRLGLEGVVGKRKDSAYVLRRSSGWVKLKCGQRQEFVIGGYTDPRGSRTGLGSLLLGVHDDEGRLRYAGNVGTGFSEQTLRELRAKLGDLHADASPSPPTPSFRAMPIGSSPS